MNKKIHFLLYFNAKQCLNSYGDKEAIESYKLDFNLNKNDKTESVKKEEIKMMIIHKQMCFMNYIQYLFMIVVLAVSLYINIGKILKVCLDKI